MTLFSVRTKMHNFFYQNLLKIYFERSVGNENKSALYSLVLLRGSVYGEAGPISAWRLGNTAPKKRRNGDDTASNLTGPGIQPQTFRTDNNVLRTELTGHVGNENKFVCIFSL